MAQIKWLCFVLFILVMLSMTWHGRVSGATKKDATYLTQQGIRSVKEMASIMASIKATPKVTGTVAKGLQSSLVKSVSAASGAAGKAAQGVGKIGMMMKAVSFIGKAAPFLSVAGFLIPMILGIVGGDSAQVKLLKAEFFKVNKKLDEMTKKLDKINSKITLENQKAAYLDEQETIKFSYGKIELMINQTGAVNCEAKTAKECQREKIQIGESFVKYFENTEIAMHTIFQPGDGSVFKEPLMKMMRENYECDIPKLTEIFKKLWGLSKNAQMVVQLKEKLSGSKMSVVQSTDTYLKMIYKFRADFYTQINECRRQMFETNKTANLFVKDIKAKEDKSLLEIKKTLEEKYNWFKWVSVLICFSMLVLIC